MPWTIAATALALMTGTAAACLAIPANGMHGSLFILENPGELPTLRPTDCDLFVRGERIDSPTGTLTLVRDRGVNGLEDVTSLQIETTPSSNGKFRFIAGPITATEDGRHHVRLDLDPDHLLISPTFTIECENGGGQGDGGQDDGDFTIAPDCPTGLTVTPESGGNNLTWTPAANAEVHLIERAPAGTDDYELLAALDADADTYLDTDVTDGQTNNYRVRAQNNIGQSENCATVEATAIPYFGNAITATIALIGATLIATRKRNAH